MKITIESTGDIAVMDGIPVRHWKGMTESGVPCDVFVHRIAVREDRDTAAFEAELREMARPVGTIGLRYLLP